MAYRLRHFLLAWFLGLMSLLSSTTSLAQKSPDLNNEFFELGADFGVLAIQDFNSEYSVGVDATFHASEDFFLQINFLTAEAGLSSFEESQRPYFEGDDRTFLQYGVLLGYNIFAGELFVKEGRSTLSNLYIVGGAGNITFGDEQSFSTALGIGYKLGLSRRFNLRFDFRDHIYESNLIQGNAQTHNMRFSVGVGFLL